MIQVFFHPLLRPYFLLFRKKLIILLVLAVIASVFEGISAGMTIPVIHSLFHQGSMDNLPWIIQKFTGLFAGIDDFQTRALLAIGSLVLAVMVKSLFVGLTSFKGTYLSSLIMADLRSKIISHLLHAESDFFSGKRTGDLVEKALHFTEKIEGLLIVLVKLAAKLVSIFALLLMLCAISLKLTILSICLGFLIAISINYFLKILSRVSRENAELNIKLASSVYENLSGVNLIKSFSKEDRQTEKTKKIIYEQRKPHQFVMFGNSVIQIITECFAIICLGVILIAALFFNEKSASLLLEVIPFIFILTKIIPGIQMINKTRGAIAGRIQYADMLLDTFSEAKKKRQKDQGANLFSYEDVISVDIKDFSYDGTAKVLKDIKIEVKKGDQIALVGRSGSGKSTLISLLMRGLELTNGEIKIDNKSIDEFTRDSYLGKIGYVSQDIFLFHGSVRENLLFGIDEGKELSDKEILSVCDLSSCRKFIESLPQGLDTILGEDGASVSGGQKQMIAIARALLREPEIIIFDEATSALDNTTEGVIKETIKKISKSRTVIIVAHRLSSIVDADNIFVFNMGRISESGSYHSLMNKKGDFYDIVQSGESG